MVPSPRPRASYSLTGVTPASTVLVYRNGDPFYLGRKFVIHDRYVRTFEALIAQLNEGVEVPFGVRTLYTPQEGHRVRNLSDLKQGGKYVAAGRERFKKLDYIHIGIKKPQRRKKVVVIKPVVHSKIRVPSRWQLISNKPRNINVFTNGDMLIPPIKFIIPRFTLKNWNCVLALINEKIFPRSGGVHRLYTLDGHAVRNSDGLEDNHYYVAVGKEKFKSLPYWRSSRVSPEVQRYGESPKRPRKKKARVPAQIVQEEEIVAPSSTPADEVEEGGSPYEDIEKKEKKKEWSFKNMFGFFLKKPGEDKTGESEQNQPAEEPLPEQINEKKGT
nr:doublecortin domain-containing protein 2C isoform X5 [Chrysemys picta bellii]